ncbi:cyclic nucleotide-binding domain-containing protein [Balneola sp. MJW-20]|uniref:cyclic nucleotide-binding domain-containing protein n=1 Tax=Gracilimonas aurantiaca TaxID=3234185 RepID=UPI0034673815
MFKKFRRLKTHSDLVFNSGFLSNLSPVQRYEFLQLCHKRSYKQGEFVFYKNDPGTGMYFIEKGKVQLTIDIPDETIPANENEGIILKCPNNFGALSIGYELRRKSSARCLTDCDLLGFFKPDFEVLRDRHPQIAVKYLQTLTNIALKQLESTTNRLSELSDEQTALQLQFDTYYQDLNTDSIE